jgi:predicted dehydrogenase
MNNIHMLGYKAAPNCQVVALADIDPAAAKEFQAKHGLAGAKVYTDYHAMLATEKPDMVSIATWPKLHCEMVLASADAGVKAIHCEKPIALTWGDAKRMVSRCRETGAQLTFNHQRRFLEPFRKAKQLITSAAIGKLVAPNPSATTSRLARTTDIMFYLNDETPVNG